MNQMQSINNITRSNNTSSLKGLAFAMSVIVYLAALLYAGVRSYSLFSATIEPELLPIAILGIIALEISALALPISIHYWVSPGSQRMIAFAFYFADLCLIVFNSILDAAHHAGAVLPEFMQVYGLIAVPALPVFCMAGWALIWMFDNASKEADMKSKIQSATQMALMEQMMQATASVDITEAVQQAALEAARSLVGETLGKAPKRQADHLFANTGSAYPELALNRSNGTHRPGRE